MCNVSADDVVRAAHKFTNSSTHDDLRKCTHVSLLDLNYGSLMTFLRKYMKQSEVKRCFSSISDMHQLGG